MWNKGGVFNPVSMHAKLINTIIHFLHRIIITLQWRGFLLLHFIIAKEWEKQLKKLETCRSFIKRTTRRKNTPRATHTHTRSLFFIHLLIYAARHT